MSLYRRPVGLATLATLVAVGSLWAVASFAAAPPRLPARPVVMTLDVEISGGQTITWSGRQGTPPNPCSSWSQSSGRQEINFGMGRRARTKAIMPRGPGLIPPSFSAASKIKGTIERSWKVKEHLAESGQPCEPCGPNSEYGPCGPPTVQPGPPPTDCAPIRGTGFASAVLRPAGSGDPASLVDVLEVRASLRPGSPFRRCNAPTVPKMEWTVVKGVARLRRMKPGDRLKLTARGAPVVCKGGIANLTCKVESDVEISVVRLR